MSPSIFTGYLLQTVMRPIIVSVTRIIKVTPFDGWVQNRERNYQKDSVINAAQDGTA